jgi:two-component system phosphate regulon response regulator PhoB
MPKILIVDDEPAIREMVKFSLESAGFEVAEAGYADQARDQIADNRPDLMLLDWMLPGRSGLELALELRRDPATRGLPIIMLTARNEEHDKVKGLDTGTDDYITKPFSPRELVARIKAVLRRSSTAGEDQQVEIDGLHLDRESHRVYINRQIIDIAPTEFRLLEFFMTHRDRVFSRAQLLDQVWGDKVYVEERTVDVHIRRLRIILEDSGHDQLIQTVRGVGYRFSNKRG